MKDNDEEPMIDQKYYDMVERFKMIPANNLHQCVERMKLVMFQYEPWYKTHKDQLTRDERHLLNENITRLESEEEIDSDEIEIPELIGW